MVLWALANAELVVCAAAAPDAGVASSVHVPPSSTNWGTNAATLRLCPDTVARTIVTSIVSADAVVAAVVAVGKADAPDVAPDDGAPTVGVVPVGDVVVGETGADTGAEIELPSDGVPSGGGVGDLAQPLAPATTTSATVPVRMPVRMPVKRATRSPFPYWTRRRSRLSCQPRAP